MDPQNKLPTESWRASQVSQGQRRIVIVEGPYRRVSIPRAYALDSQGRIESFQLDQTRLEDVRTDDPMLSAPEFLYIVHAKGGALLPRETWDRIAWSKSGLEYPIRLRSVHFDLRRQAIDAFLALEPNAFHLLNAIPNEDDALRAHLLSTIAPDAGMRDFPREIFDNLLKCVREDPRRENWRLTVLVLAFRLRGMDRYLADLATVYDGDEAASLFVSMHDYEEMGRLLRSKLPERTAACLLQVLAERTSLCVHGVQKVQDRLLHDIEEMQKGEFPWLDLLPSNRFNDRVKTTLMFALGAPDIRIEANDFARGDYRDETKLRAWLAQRTRSNTSVHRMVYMFLRCLKRLPFSVSLARDVNSPRPQPLPAGRCLFSPFPLTFSIKSGSLRNPVFGMFPCPLTRRFTP